MPLGNTRRRTWATTKEHLSRLLITVHMPGLVGGRDGVSRRTIVPMSSDKNCQSYANYYLSCLTFITIKLSYKLLVITSAANTIKQSNTML